MGNVSHMRYKNSHSIFANWSNSTKYFHAQFSRATLKNAHAMKTMMRLKIEYAIDASRNNIRQGSRDRRMKKWDRCQSSINSKINVGRRRSTIANCAFSIFLFRLFILGDDNLRSYRSRKKNLIGIFMVEKILWGLCKFSLSHIFEDRKFWILVFSLPHGNFHGGENFMVSPLTYLKPDFSGSRILEFALSARFLELWWPALVIRFDPKCQSFLMIYSLISLFQLCSQGSSRIFMLRNCRETWSHQLVECSNEKDFSFSLFPSRSRSLLLLNLTDPCSLSQMWKLISPFVLGPFVPLISYIFIFPLLHILQRQVDEAPS